MRIRCVLLLGGLLLAGTATQVDAQHDHGGGPFATHKHKAANYMGVDSTVTTHEFVDLDDGGRITLAGNPSDAAATSIIRTNLRQIMEALQKGDFDAPLLATADHVPGTDLMASRRTRITYALTEVPGGGEIRITTTDAMARVAIRGFLGFQREEHQQSHSH